MVLRQNTMDAFRGRICLVVIIAATAAIDAKAVKNGATTSKFRQPRRTRDTSGSCAGGQKIFPNCTSFPSKPKDVSVQFVYNTITTHPSLKVTWKGPEYGTGDHFGYEVEMFAVNGHQACWHLSAKTHVYIFRNVNWNTDCTVRVISLPRNGGNISSQASSRQIKTPKRCDYYEKNSLGRMIFDCYKVENLHVAKQCYHGNATVKWNAAPQRFNFSEYSIMYQDTREKIRGTYYADIKFTENDLSYEMTSLKDGHSYKLYASLYSTKHNKASAMTSVMIHCRAPSALNLTTVAAATKDPEPKSPQTSLVLGLMGVAIGIILVVAVAVVVYFRRAVKKPAGDATLSLMRQTSANAAHPVVLLVYYRGCQHVQSLAVQLAKILNDQGIVVNMDLLDRIQVDRTGLGVWLEESGMHADFIVFLCTQKLDLMLDCHSDFKFMVDLSRTAMVQNMNPTTKNIAVHLQSDNSPSNDYVPPFLHQLSYQCHNQLEDMISTICGIAPLMLQDDAVVRHCVIVQEKSKITLEMIIKRVLENHHRDCRKKECSKGFSDDASLHSAQSEASLQSFDLEPDD